MSNIPIKITAGNAAVLAGIGYILMLATPFAEFYVFPKIMVDGNVDETVRNLYAHKDLFRYAIVGYLVNFFGDILAAWALYILLKPVNEHLSLLTAWLRLIYTILSLAALLNLVNVLALINTAQPSSQVNQLIDFGINAFRNGWSFTYVFFGSHLLLLGYLSYRSGYIPKFIGVLLMLAGLSWLVSNLQPLLFPNLHIDFSIIAILGIGELVFMFWLLIWGRKVKAGE